jgi:hypothetical protein
VPGEAQQNQVLQRKKTKAKKKNKGPSKIKNFLSKVKDFKPFKKKKKNVDSMIERPLEVVTSEKRIEDIDYELITRSLAVPFEGMEESVPGAELRETFQTTSPLDTFAEDFEPRSDPFYEIDVKDAEELRKKKENVAKNLTLRNLRTPKYFEELAKVETLLDMDHVNLEFPGLGVPVRLEVSLSIYILSLIIFVLRF